MSKVPTAVGVLVAIVVAAACVRLGFWQISRLHEKQALNARLRAAIAAAPADLAAADRAFARDPDSLRFGRWTVRGRYDEAHQFLLMGRARNGEPGVEVITPLVPDESTSGGPGGQGALAVLVNRGWIPSIDAATAKPEQYPAPGVQRVTGLGDPLPRRAGRPPGAYTRVEIDSLAVWSVTALDADSVAAHLPYPVRPYVLRALPDSAAAADAMPVPAPVRYFDEAMHRSYAGQWFSFAVITLVGMVVLARKRRAA
jgi:surfeit locus 1 family protein